MQKHVSGKEAKESVLSMNDAELSAAVKMLLTLAGVDEKTAERLGGNPGQLRRKLSSISEDQIGALLSTYGNADVMKLLERIRSKNAER